MTPPPAFLPAQSRRAVVAQPPRSRKAAWVLLALAFLVFLPIALFYAAVTTRGERDE